MSVIMLPTWSIDGITFNSSDSNGVEWIVEEEEGWEDSPGPRLATQEKPAGDGDYDSDTFLESRLVILRGYVLGPTRSVTDLAIRQMAAWLSAGTRQTMTVTEPDRVLAATVRRAAKSQTHRMSPTCFAFEAKMIAPDPRKYSTTTKSLSTGLASPPPGGVLWGGSAGSTGVPWNGPAGTTGVVWQSGVGSTGVITLTNAGTAATPIRFTISDMTEAVVQPSIVDITNGYALTYGGTVAANSTLVIDTDTGSVLMDGANRGPLMSRADFFSVPPQSSISVQFDAAAPAPNASLLAQWSDAYI